MEHRRTRQRAGLIAVAMAGLIAVAPSEEARAASAVPNRAQEECLWPKRDCYPPARLWYRISVDFMGSYAYAAEAGELSAPGPPADPPGVSGSIAGRERWELKSNTAVILTLRCVDINFARQEPFLVKRRINGRRRTIGGCPHNAAGRFRPTASFAANASGETRSWRQTTTIDPYTSSAYGECQGVTDERALISSHGLQGQLSTGSSLTEAVEVSVGEAPPTGDGNIHQGERRCASPDTGEEAFYSPPRDSPIQGFYTPLLGNEYLYSFPDSDTPWRPAWFLLRFAVRAGNFGGSYIIQSQAGQSQLEPGNYPPPPTAPLFEVHNKDYVYTVRLEPCPDKALDVDGC